MSTITLSKAKEWVGDRGCRVGDFLYMAPIAVPSSLGNAIGIGATEESAKLDAETEAARTKARSITTSCFASCLVSRASQSRRR